MDTVGKTPDPDQVICPNCAHQFPAIPENVQERLSECYESFRKIVEWLESLDRLNGAVTPECILAMIECIRAADVVLYGLFGLTCGNSRHRTCVKECIMEPKVLTSDDAAFAALVEQARKNVAPIVEREMANEVHTLDCAVHLPVCRPCSCCLETRLRARNAALLARAELAEHQLALIHAITQARHVLAEAMPKTTEAHAACDTYDAARAKLDEAMK